MGVVAAVTAGAALAGSTVTTIEGQKAARNAQVKAGDEAARQQREQERLMAEAEQAEQDKEAAEKSVKARDARRRKQLAAGTSGRAGTILTQPQAGQSIGGGSQGGKTLLGG